MKRPHSISFRLLIAVAFFCDLGTNKKIGARRRRQSVFRSKRFLFIELFRKKRLETPVFRVGQFSDQNAQKIFYQNKKRLLFKKKRKKWETMFQDGNNHCGSKDHFISYMQKCRIMGHDTYLQRRANQLFNSLINDFTKV